MSATLYSVINFLADLAEREVMFEIYGFVDVVGFLFHPKIGQMGIDEMEGSVKTCGNLPVQRICDELIDVFKKF